MLIETNLLGKTVQLYTHNDLGLSKKEFQYEYCKEYTGCVGKIVGVYYDTARNSCIKCLININGNVIVRTLKHFKIIDDSP